MDQYTEAELRLTQGQVAVRRVVAAKKY